MKKGTRLLFEKSLDSLLLSIEHFNRPWNRGRPEAVLILLDRAFELLLKTIILHKGGKIREPGARETIGHEKCVRKCITEEPVKCLTDEQGLTIQIINSFRDAAQHDIVELSERDLYTYCQAGVTLYRDLIRKELKEELKKYLPERVLPISTEPPKDLHTMIEADFKEIKALVKPGARRHIDARVKLKSLAIIESSLEGVRSQPTENELQKLIKEVQSGKKWQDIFPGVASLELSTKGTGIGVDIRITKKEGEAVHLVPEGTPGATVLAVKRVNELDFYSLSSTDMAKKLGVSPPRLLALITSMDLQSSEDYYKKIKIGKVEFKRYSGKALDVLAKKLPEVNLDAIWAEYRPKKG
jgi:hypothetical protein